MGNVSSVPAGYSIATVVVLSSGVNSAMDAWGDVLLATYGKKRRETLKSRSRAHALEPI